jgi:glutamate formiminotransferase
VCQAAGENRVSQNDPVLECVVNISEGVRTDVLEEIIRAGGSAVLDVHSDPHHHRSVLTLAGPDAVRPVAARAVELLDLDEHIGVHPRLGVVDVVPFVAYSSPNTDADAEAARDAFAAWAATELDVPCFLYSGLPDGPHPTLPEVRRRAWHDLLPDVGPGTPHPTAGAMCVGARPLLVAYNVWLPRSVSIEQARAVATAVRRPGIRTLGLLVGDRPQISMNLIDPLRVTPADAFDAVAELIDVEGAELVGLVPQATLEAIDPGRWDRLDLGVDRTVEARLLTLGSGPGRSPQSG